MPTDEESNISFSYKRPNPYSHVEYRELKQRRDHLGGVELSVPFNPDDHHHFASNTCPRHADTASPRIGKETDYSPSDDGGMTMACDEEDSPNRCSAGGPPNPTTDELAPIFLRNKKIAFVEDTVITLQDYTYNATEMGTCVVCGKTVPNTAACYYCGRIACSDHIRKCADCSENFCYFCISLDYSDQFPKEICPVCARI